MVKIDLPLVNCVLKCNRVSNVVTDSIPTEHWPQQYICYHACYHSRSAEKCLQLTYIESIWNLWIEW